MSFVRPDPTSRPAWSRPENFLGEPVPLTLLLARSEKAVIRLQNFAAYRTGFEFELVAYFRPTSNDEWDPMKGLAGLRGRPGDRSGEASSEHLRFSVEFPDGSAASNFGPPLREPLGQTRQGPLMQILSGESEGGRARATYWIWPLPGKGSLSFCCEWPQYDVPLTRKPIATESLLASAARASELWPLP